MAFLEKIAKLYLEQYGNDLHQFTFVFPTRRACLYFMRHLQQHKGEHAAIWAPPLYSANDFIASLSSLKVPDQLDLIFELHRIYDRNVGSYKKKFKDFYPWGKMILSDFNEIDRHLVDTEKLFRTLQEIKEIEDFTKDEKADIYNRYTGFWASLGHLYTAFNAFLREKGKGYPGMIYREAAENIETIAAQKINGTVVFCGFNALTKAEETIIRHLKEIGQAEIFWDMDRYFLDDINQEAGHFARQNIKTFESGTPNWVEETLTQPKTITLIGVQSRVSQAKVLGIKLKQLETTMDTADRDDSDPQNIAVVLPDETLLFPTLNSLPDSFQRINVSIGFPLRQTPVFSLLDAVFQMQERIAEKGVPGPGQAFEGFYYKDVLSILNHPYIKPMTELLDPPPAPSKGENTENETTKDETTKDETSEDDVITTFFRELITENIVYVPTEFIAQRLPVDIITDMFRIRIQPKELMDFFLLLLDRIRIFFSENKPDIFSVDYEYIYHFYTLMSRLKDSIKNAHLNLESIETFRQLFTDIVTAEHIPFTGEPVEGLQILGMLETQALDFDNLFILSVNEGHLPSGKGGQSFIPLDIRGMLGMPTYKEQDAVSAYHFYRLLKNSGNITLIYITESKGIEKSEKSRFIEQLLIEYADRNRHAVIHHQVVDFSFDTQPPTPVSVPKTDAVMKKLLVKNYSASSLLTYLQCSLKFYFTYVLRLFDEDEIAESPDYKDIGHIIHETLEELFKPYSEKGITVTPFELSKIDALVDSTLHGIYSRKIKTGSLTTGRNLIIYEVMKAFLHQFVEKEKQGEHFKVLMLEKEIDDVFLPIRLPDGDNVVNARLGGTIDRLDVTTDNVYRIIDYKTGKINSLKLKSMEELQGSDAVKRKEIFQLLLYRYLLQGKNLHPGRYRLGVYPFKKLYDQLSVVTIAGSEIIDDSVMQDFELILKDIFKDLFHHELPFTQTEDEKHCRTCPYVNICSRDAGETYL